MKVCAVFVSTSWECWRPAGPLRCDGQLQLADETSALPGRKGFSICGYMSVAMCKRASLLNLAGDFRLTNRANKLQTLPPQRSYICVTFHIEPTFA
jgi:hypothetical protein